MLHSFDVPLEFVLHNLLVQETLNGSDDNVCEVCELILRACYTVSSTQNLQEEQTDTKYGYQPSVIMLQTVGGPRFEIGYDQLSFLLEN